MPICARHWKPAPICSNCVSPHQLCLIMPTHANLYHAMPALPNHARWYQFMSQFQSFQVVPMCLCHAVPTLPCSVSWSLLVTSYVRQCQSCQHGPVCVSQFQVAPICATLFQAVPLHASLCFMFSLVPVPYKGTLDP